MKAEPREPRGRGKHVDLDAFAQSTENLLSLPPSMHAAIKMSYGFIRYTHIRTKICRIYRIERYRNFLEPKPSCCQRLLWILPIAIIAEALIVMFHSFARRQARRGPDDAAFVTLRNLKIWRPRGLSMLKCWHDQGQEPRLSWRSLAREVMSTSGMANH